jgi:triphosphatase
MPQEIELKLLASPTYLKALRAAVRAMAPQGARLSTRRLASYYFDAPDSSLWSAGIALRVRKIGRRWVQTLKAGGPGQAGLHSRAEWESPVPGPQPDLARLIAAHPADAALRTAAAHVASMPALHHIFVTDFRRSALTFPLDGGGGVEIALDQGAIAVGERSVPICEVELELKGGEVGALFRLARTLRHSAPLRVGRASKAERGYALLRDGLAAPAKAKPVHLDTAMTVDDAFAACFSACVVQLQDNEPGFNGTPEAEYVHQMRVAVRRLRALFGLMQSIVPKAVFAPISAELKWLAGALGPARDWYVFLHETLPPLSAATDRPELALLAERAELALQQGVRDADAAVQSERYTDLMLLLAEFAATRGWRAGDPELLAAPIEPFAARLLLRRHRQLLKRGAGLGQARAETRHAVRIAAKKLRYGLEFFMSVLPEKRARAVQSVLTELQDLLGRLNDAAVAETMIARLCDDGAGAEMQRAAGLLEGWLLARSERSLGALDEAWTRFTKLRPPAK